MNPLDKLRERKNTQSFVWKPVPPRDLRALREPPQVQQLPQVQVQVPPSKFLSSGAEAALLGILQKEQPLSLAEIVRLAPEYKKRVIADALQRLRKKNKAINHPVKIEGRFVWHWLKC